MDDASFCMYANWRETTTPKQQHMPVKLILVFTFFEGEPHDVQHCHCVHLASSCNGLLPIKSNISMSQVKHSYYPLGKSFSVPCLHFQLLLGLCSFSCMAPLTKYYTENLSIQCVVWRSHLAINQKHSYYNFYCCWFHPSVAFFIWYKRIVTNVAISLLTVSIMKLMLDVVMVVFLCLFFFFFSYNYSFWNKVVIVFSVCNI